MESNMWAFMEYVNRELPANFTEYPQLYDWSVSQPVLFWDMLWDYFGIIGEKDSARVRQAAPGFMEGGWFPGAKLNYAENMLRYMEGNEPAITFCGENQTRTQLSRGEVRCQVLALAKALKAEGVGEGDVVAGYLPNLPETILSMLAAAAVGAIWCSCATDIGPGAIIDRIGQTNPKVLITADGYYYKGHVFSLADNVRQITRKLPSLRRLITVHYAGEPESLDDIPLSARWTDYLKDDSEDFSFSRYDYDHPLVIMFSSGTTGKPKCMVQSAMGLLLNQLKELILHSDLKPSDSLLYITTCSWMMWNWQAAALGTGARLVLYDGNPSWPDVSAIWQVLEQEKVTVFGLSASYIHALLNQGFQPAEAADLSALREISQTGSALSEEGFSYVYSNIKEDLFFNSIAGGTDINGCFAIANPLQPVYSGELQDRGLGMKINCYDENGRPVRDQQGELVCEFPVPSMPLYFWNDPDKSRYRSAYFDVYEGVWRHGDYVVFHTDTRGITFYGRSDSVLKPSGVRIGTAEIYNQVEQLPEIAESLAIGQNWHNDQRILLFVKCNDGYHLDESLEKKIKTTLRQKASPRHAPAVILEVPDIPHTLNGKKVESAVTNIVNGRTVTNRDALSNPESLAFFEQLLPKLQA